ncbi:hypothetical protein HETIRDRAFT_481614 [Heterobasidion irregulare TC 32-1]|uniref:Uncharacterized protein n=1 Tax=Heterobasidion irregulare (strain TC 32-1) TaxID=747525 RepID=W4JRL4_HETIT|nr:uncharacterized protein HETIRDRAFT_481614 [Heterobasidion irregulare TC 32-1]ETW76104.1 hypothetical protein HETIRDRAFT_481614 [Heterobasidion irregulare TC 32-1]
MKLCYVRMYIVQLSARAAVRHQTPNTEHTTSNTTTPKLRKSNAGTESLSLPPSCEFSLPNPPLPPPSTH